MSHSKDAAKDPLSCLAEHFIFAGTSALLLAIVHIQRDLWCISLITLVPFLWRAVKSSVAGSVLLGSLLATFFCFATTPIVSGTVPGGLPVKLCILNSLFILYAVSVNRATRLIGRNAVLMAILWLPVEFVLSRSSHVEGMFSFTETDSTLAIRIGSLFGMLMVSFAVILMNWAVLGIVDYVARKLHPCGGFNEAPKMTRDDVAPSLVIEESRSLFPMPRSPPRPLTLRSREQGISHTSAHSQVEQYIKEEYSAKEIFENRSGGCLRGLCHVTRYCLC